jgi:hypothetical protein
VSRHESSVIASGSTVLAHHAARAVVTIGGHRGAPGTGTAQFPSYVIIIMWKFGTRQCLMVLNGELISVRLIDGISVLRDVGVLSPQAALCTAEMWEAEERSVVGATDCLSRPRAAPLIDSCARRYSGDVGRRRIVST